jgi:DNA polymerase-3 subunit delta
MIKKIIELDEKILSKNHFFLLHGKNEGLKNNVINKISKKRKILIYEEKEILDNENIFFESILTKSLFDDQKIITIKRVSDKIVKILDKLKNYKIEDIVILNSDYLDKKSKLRTFFEKEKDIICIAFYPDNDQTLLKLTYDFLKRKKISISSSNINLIVSKCDGDRENLLNELNKVEYYSKNGKKINTENLKKLVNLIENHDISELIDNCLAKNEKKTLLMLNENNFSYDDSIVILRTFLNKSKKILDLALEYEKNNNIDLTISKARPPIFWKNKEITKQQIYKWKPSSIKKLIYQINTMELLVKKNFNNSTNFITDFLLEQSSESINN